MFQDFSNDKIWGVRKAAAIALADVSKAVPSDVRLTEIMQIFEHLNEDVSRWVKSALLESLGPFIASFLGTNEVGHFGIIWLSFFTYSGKLHDSLNCP